MSNELPAGAITLTEVGGEGALPDLDGFPRAVPYGADSGEHTIALQPDVELVPCTWYRVDTTEALLDADDAPVTPHSWTFRTGLDAQGNRCPDDPYTARENHIRAVYGDLFGRAPGDGEVRGWTDQLDRGLTTPPFVSALVGSTEHRGRLVDAAYQSDLGRPADAAGRAFWTAYLRTHSVTAMRTRLLASAEVYATGGGTDAAYVAHLYDVVLERPVDDPGSAYWAGQLAADLSRAQVARRLLVSAEVSQRAVRDTYADLLGRAPSGADVAYWAPRVAATDTRTLTRVILRSPEYIAAAQPA